MSDPDLALIPNLIVAQLRAFPDLAPLSVTEADGSVVSAIVGINEGDLLTQIQAALNRLNVSVTVLLESAAPDMDPQSPAVIYDPVHVLIEVAELVALNQQTASSVPAGTGTGLQAWTIADRITAALQYWSIPLSKPQRLLPRAPGIINSTTKEDADAGYKVLRLHFTTQCMGVQRPSAIAQP